MFAVLVWRAVISTSSPSSGHAGRHLAAAQQTDAGGFLFQIVEPQIHVVAQLELDAAAPEQGARAGLGADDVLGGQQVAGADHVPLTVLQGLDLALQGGHAK